MAIQAPFQGYTPEMLAQMAQQAFRPPPPMQMGGGGQQQGGQPGFNVGQSASALGAGLGEGLSGWLGGASSKTPAEGLTLGGGAGGGMTTVGPGGQYSVTGLGGDTAPMPTSTTVGGMQPDFFTNLLQYIRG
jgi:hypothetical protein